MWQSKKFDRELCRPQVRNSSFLSDSINQVTYSLALVIVIMIFHESRTVVTFSASLTHPTLSPFLEIDQIFLSLFSLASFLDPSCSHSMPQTLFSSHGRKRMPGIYVFYFLSDRVVSASRDTVSFEFFVFHEIRSILLRSHIFVTHIWSQFNQGWYFRCPQWFSKFPFEFSSY